MRFVGSTDSQRHALTHTRLLTGLCHSDKVISEDSLHSGDGIRIERLTLGGQTNEKVRLQELPHPLNQLIGDEQGDDIVYSTRCNNDCGVRVGPSMLSIFVLIFLAA